MSTHYLCFRAKLRKNVYHCKPQFYYIKVGVRGYILHGLVIMMVVRVARLIGCSRVTVHKLGTNIQETFSTHSTSLGTV